MGEPGIGKTILVEAFLDQASAEERLWIGIGQCAEKVDVPVLGIVENMSTHICSNCGHEEHIFGEGGAERMGKDYGVDVLGHLPLDIHIREQADSGKPTVVADPDGRVAEIYREIARRTAAKLALQAKDFSARFPKIVIQNT